MMNEFTIIDYKNLYKELTPHLHSRQSVLSKLDLLINQYKPFIKNLKEDKNIN